MTRKGPSFLEELINEVTPGGWDLIFKGFGITVVLLTIIFINADWTP